mmetsp:Transcript_85481/g.276838  ORF Transcript_85481/g.276838 Transcript_85481/m.276838 type:complete len:264 (-) Transcript_85481:96-887(-)
MPSCSWIRAFRCSMVSLSSTSTATVLPVTIFTSSRSVSCRVLPAATPHCPSRSLSSSRRPARESRCCSGGTPSLATSLPLTAPTVSLASTSRAMVLPRGVCTKTCIARPPWAGNRAGGAGRGEPRAQADDDQGPAACGVDGRHVLGRELQGPQPEPAAAAVVEGGHVAELAAACPVGRVGVDHAVGAHGGAARDPHAGQRVHARRRDAPPAYRAVREVVADGGPVVVHDYHRVLGDSGVLVCVHFGPKGAGHLLPQHVAVVRI